MRRSDARRKSQEGMTLIEVLVAITVFTVVFVSALALYQAANRAYLSTDSATIQQQNARFALDRMTETIRDAGGNHNPLGRSNVADEQIEGAWQSALFVRADFDNASHAGLQSTTFPLVTTSNREIVGYVLRKPNGNNLSISIKADFSAPRNAIKNGSTITNEETVTIPVAATNLSEQTAPPYQLTRVTFDAAGNPVYEVISDNVFRLSFQHLNAASTPVITATTAFGGADAERAVRATVRTIGVQLITMGDRPDLGYRDPATYTTDAFGQTAPAEGAATKNRRKFNLAQQILAVNLGRKGARHNVMPAVTIAPPTSITACTGHCRSFHLSWPASTTPGIATYKLRIQAGAPFIDQYVNVPSTSYTFVQSDPTIQAYTFTVAGMAGSAVGAYSVPVTATATHDTTNSVPSVATNVGAAQASGINALDVTWNAVTTNTGTITSSTCVSSAGGNSAPPSPWNSAAVDIGRYEVYRVLADSGGVAAFTPAPANRVDNLTINDLQNVTPTTTSQLIDRTAAPCGRYFYRVRTFDGCGLVAPGDGSAPMSASASFIPASGIAPAVPTTPAPAGPVTYVGGNYTVTLNWPAVVRDSTNAPAAVAHYEVVRERRLGSGAWTPLSSLHVYPATSVVSITDTVPDQVSGQPASYRYAAKAIYDCGALGDSDRSNQSGWYTLTCNPPVGNTIAVTIPANGSAVSRPYENGFAPRLTTVGGAWTGASIEILDPSGTVIHTDSITGAPVSNQYNFANWDASSLPDGTYTLRAVGWAGSCRSVPAISTFTLETGTCGLVLINPSVVPNSGTPSNRRKELQFQLQNTCDASPITINGLTLTWSGAPVGAVINAVRYAAANNTSGLTTGSGTLIPLMTSITINAGATSSAFNIVYNLQHTPGGTTWSSIVARTTAPSNDETLTGPIAP